MTKWRGWVSCLALVALLMVLTAPLWHGHEHEEGDHQHPEQSCPVCVAVRAPTSDALSAAEPCVLRLERVALVVVDDERAGEVLALRIGWARGPPARRAA